MFAVIRQAYSMLDDAPAAAGGDEHYLYFKGVPLPPTDYRPPLGASPNTWPQVYNNLQNIDFCTENFSHIGNRIKCMKAYTVGPLLP